MKNSNNQFEQEFKNQLDEREILPTRDLWSEIENQTENLIPKKNKINWYLLAACLLLMFSLSVVLLFNNEEKIQPQLAEISIKPENPTIKTSEETQTSPVLTTQNEIVKIKENKISPTEKSELVKPQIKNEEINLPLIKENPKLVFAKPILQNSNSLAKIDSAAFQKKKKKYVDASTLLFSVEHRDLIEKTKEGRDVATIDLNTK